MINPLSVFGTRLLLPAVKFSQNIMQQIGPYKLNNNLFLAPMVGVSDTPFREICMQQGAGLTIGEMLTSNSDPVSYTHLTLPTN